MAKGDSDAVIAAVASADDEELARIRNRSVKLVDQMISSVERTLVTGTQADKAALARSVLPAILKELNAKEETDGLDEMRAQQAELMAAYKEALLGGVGARSADELSEAQRRIIGSITDDTPEAAAEPDPAEKKKPLPKSNARSSHVKSTSRRIPKSTARGSTRKG